MTSTSRLSKRKIVVFSGGTAANSLVDVFNEVLERNECTLSYVIPISDNGGSSSELIRVFGGPGIGDVRSMIFCPPPSAPEPCPFFKCYCESFQPPHTWHSRKRSIFSIFLGFGQLLLLSNPVFTKVCGSDFR